MAKVALYTCITKGYDSSVPRVTKSDQFERCILFTDDCRLRSAVWESRPLASPEKLERSDLVNRYHKFHAERLLPECDLSVYIDGNVDICQDIRPLIDIFLESNALFGCFRHPQRTSIAEEADACIRLNKFKSNDSEKWQDQISSYQRDGFPQDFPLLAATVLFRRHGINGELDKAMTEWWHQVNEYSCRDQLSLPYILWKTKLPYKVFDLNIFDNPYFFRGPHISRDSYSRKMIKYLNKTLRRFLGKYSADRAL